MYVYVLYDCAKRTSVMKRLSLRKRHSRNEFLEVWRYLKYCCVPVIAVVNIITRLIGLCIESIRLFASVVVLDFSNLVLPVMMQLSIVQCYNISQSSSGNRLGVSAIHLSIRAIIRRGCICRNHGPHNAKSLVWCKTRDQQLVRAHGQSPRARPRRWRLQREGLPQPRS